MRRVTAAWGRRLILAALLNGSVAFGAGAGELAPVLTEVAGAHVAAFSSEYGSGWEAANLVLAKDNQAADGSPIETRIWSSATNAPFPHWILFEFDAPHMFETFVFDNWLEDEESHPGISARGIELWVGNSPDTLTKVAAFELERNRKGQSVRIAPAEGRFLKYVISSNWGHPWYTELGYTRVIGVDEPADDLALKLKADGRADLYGLYFDFGSARLREESQPVLEQILALSKANPGLSFVVEGHTDSVGDPDYNRKLSYDRAAAVVRALVALGAPEGLFEAQGFGADRPVADNGTDEGRARNRRVTLRAVGASEPHGG